MYSNTGDTPKLSTYFPLISFSFDSLYPESIRPKPPCVCALFDPCLGCSGVLSPPGEALAENKILKEIKPNISFKQFAR